MNSDKYNEEFNDINNNGTENKDDIYSEDSKTRRMDIGREEYTFGSSRKNDEFEKINYNRDENGGDSPKSKKKKERSYPSYVLVSLTSGIIGALIFASVFSAGNGAAGKNADNPGGGNITIAASEDMNVPQAVAEKTMDAVVGITTKEVREQNSLFTGPVQQVVEGVGSGIVVDENGYILTNSHVVANGDAKDIKVLFSDGNEKEANVIWNDPSLDLAVIKVDAKGLKTAELGDSDDIQIGETAIAIGNPLGLDFERTVTSGIVSGLNRSISVSDSGTAMEGLIQTDASINSGNSGGPLLNSEGKVIGINTLKIQSSEGMGFAQPINLVKSVINEIVNTGSFEEAYIGIYGGDVLKYQQATGRDFGAEEGTLVTSIAQGSPAEKADIKAGDVITGINENKVESFQGLKKELYKYKPGDKVTLKIVREGKEMNIDVQLSNGENSLS